LRRYTEAGGATTFSSKRRLPLGGMWVRPGMIHVIWSFSPYLRTTIWSLLPNDVDDTGPCMWVTDCLVNEGMPGAVALKVGRCSLTLSKPVLKAPLVSALETTI